MVTNFVNDNINKLSSVFVKAEGSNKPSKDIYFQQNTITNLRESENVNNPIVRKELNTTNNKVNSMFEKKTAPLLLRSAKITTTIEYNCSGPYGSIKNLIDNDSDSE